MWPGFVKKCFSGNQMIMITRPERGRKDQGQNSDNCNFPTAHFTDGRGDPTQVWHFHNIYVLSLK
jgi:hypothetical protein